MLSVQTQENEDQKKLQTGTLFRQYGRFRNITDVNN